MIKIFISCTKMLRNLVIFSLCIVAIRASGQFSVLNAPEGLSFKGNEPLDSYSVKDVLNAAILHDVDGINNWSGLHIIDPFKVARRVYLLYVEGVNSINLPDNFQTYTLKGNSAYESLQSFDAEMDAELSKHCKINLDEGDKSAAYSNCFGNPAKGTVEIPAELNPDLHTEDKTFVESVNMISAASNNLKNLDKGNKLVWMEMSLKNIERVHAGFNTKAMADSIENIKNAVIKLSNGIKKNNVNSLFVVITDKPTEEPHNLSKREVLPPSDDNIYNLAEHYDPDYPVIFNIILWFMVAFGLSLLAICYAIGSMDPGRDSIIYRMTSTRMKKDN